MKRSLCWVIVVANFVASLSSVSAQLQTSVRLNEVFANNVSVADNGLVVDWVELHNTSASPVNLGGAALSDGGNTFTFPGSASIPANGFLVIYCNPLSGASVTNTGFGLKANGGVVTFISSLGNVEDSISYGIQAADFSIGRVTDGSGAWVLTQPTPRAANVAVTLGSPNGLRINEWLATGSDYIELYNPDPRPVSLAGLGLTDDFAVRNKYTIPSLSFIGVGPLGAYTLFRAANGTDANYTGFGLSAGGDSIGLYNGASQIDAVTFGPQRSGVSQGHLPDGSGPIVDFAFSPSPGAPNRDLGSITDIIINELLTHTDLPLEDAIEFRNTTGQPINMKGWYFDAVENGDNKVKTYTFTTDFIVPANGFRVLYEYQFAGVEGLRFNSAHGGHITLYQVDASGFTTAFIKRSYEEAENGVSFGYTQTSDGVDWVALSPRTFGVDSPANVAAFRRGNGLPNPGAKVGPIVINEIHYHPPDLISGGVTNDNTLDEFIELRNILSIKFPLFDPATYRATKNYVVNDELIRAGAVYADGRTNTWRLRGDVNFDFPTGIELPPGGLLLVVNFDPNVATNAQQLAAFKARFAIQPNTLIFGPYGGKLNNSGGTIELKRPDMPQGPQHPNDFRHVPYLTVDKIKYKDIAPWPPEADGTGLSLQRRVASGYGNEPLNWKAASPSPGLRNATPLTLISAPQNLAYIAGDDVAFAINVTGTAPITYQWSFKGTNLPGATNAILELQNLQPSQIGSYAVTARNDEGFISAGAILRLDSVKPVLTVTSPKPNIRWSNDTIVVQGTVRDDFGVSEVLVRLNGGEFLPASGTANWSKSLTLTAGTNVIQVAALDLGRNSSPTNTLRVIRVVPSPFTLFVNGGGSVAPSLSGQMLEVGRNYLLTATPALGQIFSNWTGGKISSANPLNFAMKSNLVLQANFVPNPFPSLKGLYNGLFFDEAAPRHDNAGFVTATVTDLGGFSAALMKSGKKYAFAGKLDLDGRATNRVSLGGTNFVSVELQLELSGEFKRLHGRVLAAAWQATLLAEPSGFPATSPTSLAGSYTVLLPGSDEANNPAGDSYGTVVVTPVGLANFSGMLADLTKAPQKIAITRFAHWPLYISLYGGKGSVFGWLNFDSVAPLNGIDGDVRWTKPVLPTAKLHRDGFAFETTVLGSRYTPPAVGSPVIDLTSTVLTFTGGNLLEPIVCDIELTPDNKIINHSTNKLVITVTPATGLFGGSIADPVSGKPIPFKGALIERLAKGGGHFSGTNVSGRVRLGN